MGGAGSVNLLNLGRKSKLRAALEAPPGKKIVKSDSSQIEARIVSHLAGCKALDDAFRRKEDVYAKFMSDVVLHYPITAETHPVERQTGKVCILSLVFGIGPSTLQKRLSMGGVPTTLENASAYVYGYRTEYKEIVDMGRELESILKYLVVNPGTEPWRFGIELTNTGIKLPSGRWLRYPQMQIQDRGLVYWSPRYKSWQGLWPGAIIENLAQSIAYDIVIAAHLKFKDEVVLNLYDAVYLVVPEEAAEDYRDRLLVEMRKPPAWMPDIPLDADWSIKQSLGEN
jgi:hypothetical protein